MSTPNDTSNTITIQLTKELVAIIDAIDADLADFKWSAAESKHGIYAGRQPSRKLGKRKLILLHRVILARILGRELLPTEQVDHINLDKLNNRRTNLRLASSAQNHWNTSKKSNNTSGLKGVSWHKRDKRWRATISCNNRQKHLGYFSTAAEAYKAYCEAAKELHGEYARFE